MRIRKPLIVLSACRRCGKPLATLGQSLLGLDGAKARLGEICDGCITAEERDEILRVQCEAIEAMATNQG